MLVTYHEKGINSKWVAPGPGEHNSDRDALSKDIIFIFSVLYALLITVAHPRIIRCINEIAQLGGGANA